MNWQQFLVFFFPFSSFDISYRQESKKKKGVKEAESDTAKAEQSVCPPPPKGNLKRFLVCPLILAGKGKDGSSNSELVLPRF